MMREMTPWHRLRNFIVRKTFSGPYRVQFYEALRFLIDNRQKLKVALEQMRDAWTDFGRRWHPFVELIDDCIDAIRENSGESTLENTLSRWLPHAEASVISAGVRSESLPEALRYAVDLTSAGKRIKQAVWQMSVYPLGLVLMLSSTLYVLNYEVIPSLLWLSPPENWTGALGFLYNLSQLVSEYGIIGGIGVVLIVIWVIWSIPNWREPDRIRCFCDDNLMPWSVYKDIQGASFLLNMAALLRAGIKTRDALDMLMENASPWLAVRLESIIGHVRQGKHLGLALRECGYAFPSRESANFLSLLQGDGADELISNYGQRWLTQTIDRVSKRAVVVRMIMFISMILMLLLLIAMVMDINTLSNSSMGTF